MGTITVGLIVVVWLFVLAPLIMRGHKPIRHAGEGFDKTRVVYEGGESIATRKRRPDLARPIARDVSDKNVDERGEQDVADDLANTGGEVSPAEILDPVSSKEGLSDRSRIGDQRVDEGYLVDDASQITPNGLGRLRSWMSKEQLHLRLGGSHDDEATSSATGVEDAEVVTSEDDEEAAAPIDTAAGDGVEADASAPGDEPRAELKGDFLSPADLMHPDADYGVIDDPEVAIDGLPPEDRSLIKLSALRAGNDDAAYGSDVEVGVGDVARAFIHSGNIGEITEEDKQFAARRSGRGGWDPEADYQRNLECYQRRRIILGCLVAVLVVTFVIAMSLGGLYWYSPLTALVLLCLYLVALRRAVVAETRLRRRRINQIRRARLGVRNKNDEKLGIPAQLRRPGGIVVELDDDSPDFVRLETISTAVDDEDTEKNVVDFEDYSRRPRRAV